MLFILYSVTHYNISVTSRVFKKRQFPPEAGVFIWYLNKVYSILNDLKIEKDLNH